MRIVVTGTGPGSIGLATAEALTAAGHEVGTSTRVNMDLTDRASVEAFAARVLDTGPIDVLINNAGVHLDLRNTWKQPQVVDGHEVHWRTNYLGTVQLTRALLPALLERAAETGEARVVHVVSKLHARGRNDAFFSDFGDTYSSWDAYGTSKLGLVHDAASLAERYGDVGLRAYSLHPGAVATGISARGMESSPVLKRLHALAAPLEKVFLKSPETGARTSVHCATAPDAVSGYYDQERLKEPARQAGDLEARAALWARTEEWLNGEAP
ncbi:SDR family NAD(P)-dependent oxidoreductase [Nocardioides marmorisolisilvae]|uniref:SDR family NAD(P)-dependent oxidoreductase n=1 Tax=Nocardioides marmorisolisilvae TaxID=1542737 RepID=A0A3N0DWK3_9ACTN|nr:SDR family NAD(P)-dependent oxidoreductase [Nocardioides marmorisolisilvae]RNL79998.1 SDR family NAD(P)-dependent oxidoreductase [Nocardioides marmorisolisilvae]